MDDGRVVRTLSISGPTRRCCLQCSEMVTAWRAIDIEALLEKTCHPHFVYKSSVRRRHSILFKTYIIIATTLWWIFPTVSVLDTTFRLTLTRVIFCRLIIPLIYLQLIFRYKLNMKAVVSFADRKKVIWPIFSHILQKLVPRPAGSSWIDDICPLTNRHDAKHNRSLRES